MPGFFQTGLERELDLPVKGRAYHANGGSIQLINHDTKLYIRAQRRLTHTLDTRHINNKGSMASKEQAYNCYPH